MEIFINKIEISIKENGISRKKIEITIQKSNFSSKMQRLVNCQIFDK